MKTWSELPGPQSLPCGLAGCIWHLKQELQQSLGANEVWCYASVHQDLDRSRSCLDEALLQPCWGHYARWRWDQSTKLLKLQTIVWLHVQRLGKRWWCSNLLHTVYLHHEGWLSWSSNTKGTVQRMFIVHTHFQSKLLDVHHKNLKYPVTCKIIVQWLLFDLLIRLKSFYDNTECF